MRWADTESLTRMVSILSDTQLVNATGLLGGEYFEMIAGSLGYCQEKQPVIDNLLDVERHQRIWKACGAIGKVLRC